jgi:hypothetical protein
MHGGNGVLYASSASAVLHTMSRKMRKGGMPFCVTLVQADAAYMPGKGMQTPTHAETSSTVF